MLVLNIKNLTLHWDLFIDTNVICGSTRTLLLWCVVLWRNCVCVLHTTLIYGFIVESCYKIKVLCMVGYLQGGWLFSV